MSQEILDRMAAILKEAGFARIAMQTSAHDWTLSAERGDLRAVVHVTDAEQVPFRAIRNDEVPEPSTIRMKATFPMASTRTSGQIAYPAGRGGTRERDEGEEADKGSGERRRGPEAT